METNYLAIKWTTSRGRNTYGWNIVTLTDTNTGKRYQTNGGGYDMTGTVFGDWLADVYQDRLMKIADQAYESYTRNAKDAETYYTRTGNDDGFYGMSYYDSTTPDGKHVSLDGATGLESMRRIAKAIGVETRSTVDSKGHTTGFIVTTTETE